MGLNMRHQALLEARGLDVELLERLGVRSSDKGSRWIEIPYYQRGSVVNHKYRTISGEKEFAQDPDAVKCFWNYDAIFDQTLEHLPLIITEGEFDAMIAMQCGFQRVVSVPDGAPVKSIGLDDAGRKYSYLLDVLANLKQIKEIILAVDDDIVGQYLLNDLAIRIGKARCKFIRYPLKEKGKPERCKDLNEIYQIYGAAGVVQAVNAAPFMRVSGLYRMSELPPIPSFPTYSTGIAGLDHQWKIRLCDFAVVTGIPGMGKTSLLNNIMGNLATNEGWVIAVASFEQKPQTDAKRNLRTYFNRIFAKLQTAEQLHAADEWIEQHFVWIVPDEDEECDLKWVLDRAEAARIQYGAKMLIVDPWNEMDHTRPQDMSLTEYTGFAIKQFRKISARMQMATIVAAHPTKLEPRKDSTLPMPTLYSISDSAHWANKSDIGVVIHKNPEYTTIATLKSKYQDIIGEMGGVKAQFLRDMGRFEVIGTL